MVSKNCARYAASWKPFGRGVGYTNPAQCEYDHPAGPMRIFAMAGVQSRRAGGNVSTHSEVNAPATAIHPIAAGSASCYALLAMRCGKTICVAVVPSSKHSYRCIHETFHQLQACGCARSRRKAKRTPCRETVEVAQKL